MRKVQPVFPGGIMARKAFVGVVKIQGGKVFNGRLVSYFNPINSLCTSCSNYCMDSKSREQAGVGVYAFTILPPR